jgi:hypothetical protein
MNKITETDEGISSDSESPTSLQSLVKQMTEKERRILVLEAEVAKVILIVLTLVNLHYNCRGLCASHHNNAWLCGLCAPTLVCSLPWMRLPEGFV